MPQGRGQQKKQKNEVPREIEGFIMTTQKGMGFVAVEEFVDKVFIPQGLLNTALPGDRVRILVHPEKKGDKERTGEVMAVLLRAKMEFVGTIEEKNGIYFFDPQSNRVYTDFIIPADKLNGAKVGQKVLITMTLWDDPRKNPFGEVIEVIGTPGENETEMQAIALDRGFKSVFPEDVERESHQIKARNAELLAQEAKVRRDFRGIATFTIDPDDAKDFDDALSIRKLTDGNFEIGIHIADPTFYISERGPIDLEAAKRGTSVYLVDRTIPMLPEVLSNDICSLNADEDKLTFSAVFTMTPEAKITDKWFGRTIIQSQKRFTYYEAQNVIDTKVGPMRDELLDLYMLSLKIRAERAKDGAISFEQDEVRFELDPAGKPIRVYKKERVETMKLIEDFMVLANSCVAEHIAKLDRNVEKTFVYRVHDLPNADRMGEVVNLIKALGYDMPKHVQLKTPQDINNLLAVVAGTEHESMIQLAAIQSMAKAIYSTKNIGHFGLSLKHYTHFTSPIRRYPDMMVHRLLARYLSGGKVTADDLAQYEALSRYETQMEIAATDAQRASVKYKQVEYMLERVGQTFDGVITGMNERGIFVEEAETKTDGMIHLRDIRDDFYNLDEKSFSIVGQKTKKKYTLGDKVKIKIMKADMDRRLVDFQLVS